MDESSVAKPDGLIERLRGAGERDDDDGSWDDDDGSSADDEECDAGIWDTLSWSFSQAQSVLDQNHALIQQVNENHKSKIPDNLVKNVALIDQINGNISKVLSIYSDLSINFSNIVHQRRRSPDIAGTASTDDDENENGCEEVVESKEDSVEHVKEKTQ